MLDWSFPYTQRIINFYNVIEASLFVNWVWFGFIARHERKELRSLYTEQLRFVEIKTRSHAGNKSKKFFKIWGMSFWRRIPEVERGNLEYRCWWIHCFISALETISNYTDKLVFSLLNQNKWNQRYWFGTEKSFDTSTGTFPLQISFLNIMLCMRIENSFWGRSSYVYHSSVILWIWFKEETNISTVKFLFRLWVLLKYEL